MRGGCPAQSSGGLAQPVIQLLAKHKGASGATGENRMIMESKGSRQVETRSRQTQGMDDSCDLVRIWNLDGAGFDSLAMRPV